MNNVNEIKEKYSKELEKYCNLNGVSFVSMQKLIEGEKTKKLVKRNALIQQSIDREIENSIENENR